MTDYVCFQKYRKKYDQWNIAYSQKKIVNNYLIYPLDNSCLVEKVIQNPLIFVKERQTTSLLNKNKTSSAPRNDL